MVIWLFSAHNQPYAFCVVTCTHSQCLPHIFIINVVYDRSAIYIYTVIFIYKIFIEYGDCVLSFNDSRVLCAVWGIIKFHLEIEPHTHMFIQIVAMLLSATAWLSQDGVCTVHHNMCFVCYLCLCAIFGCSTSNSKSY